jgi:ubiquinone/menaquinone biosynthesis C-methylase UbiE
MIRGNAYGAWSIWEHSAVVRELYAARADDTVDEMDCAAQAADLLAPMVSAGDTLLDAGCGSGYFFHSLRRRGIDIEYFGVDASASLIALGRERLPAFGLEPGRLSVIRLEDLDGEVDHVVCMNVLSNIDNYHRPLERLLSMARKSVIIRESTKRGAEYQYVVDRQLDLDVELRVHVNHYDQDELTAFMDSYGFEVEPVIDQRTGGRPEMVIGHQHHWTFFVARRRQVVDDEGVG